MSRLQLLLVLLAAPSAPHRAPPPAEECVIELSCADCLPDKMPAVTAPAPGPDGAVRVPAGGDLALSCGAAHFLLYARGRLAARCEAGGWRVAADGALRSLFELACQEDVVQDVPHAVPHCAPPLRGRAYEARLEHGTAHLATLCWDADRALTVHARVSSAPGGVPLAPHSDERAPLSLFGNFDAMFEASTRRDLERLLADSERLGRRLREMYKHAEFPWADQVPTAGSLLAAAYFPAQQARAAELASNKVVSWRGVVRGNLRALQADVAAALARARAAGAALDVYAGTHGALEAGGGVLALGAGGRVPAPRYVWTALVARGGAAGAALVLLNWPLVGVSEVRAAVFCESRCGALPWLRHTARHRAFERPALGLVFCCTLPEFRRVVADMPPVFNDTVQLLVDV